MNVLISILALFMIQPATTIEVADYTGTWNYTVEAPDLTYEGVMVLTEEGGDYSGTMSSQGVDIDLKDVEIEDDEITFSMNVQGFPCKVKGTFDGDSLKGVVSVEGFEIPLVATRKK